MTLSLPRPDDWHVHLRQGDALPGFARAHAAAFGRVLAMPNTTPPLTTPEAVMEYVRRAAAAAPGLDVRGTFRIMPGMTGDEVRALAAAGIAVGKYYPDGATTNSAGGLSHWRQAEEALAAMEAEDVVLSIHGEDPEAAVLDREEAFLPVFGEIRAAFPRLRMVLEHVTSAAGVAAVRHASERGPTAATVTVHHLFFTLDDLLGGNLQPHLFCKPIVKTPTDRAALRDAVLASDSRFCFGSDSAPHPRMRKESGAVPAGSYSAPMALQALAAWFDSENALDRLEAFVCRFGREFHRVGPNPGRVVLERKPWTIPEESEGCVPLMAGQVLSWRLAG